MSIHDTKSDTEARRDFVWRLHVDGRSEREIADRVLKGGFEPVTRSTIRHDIRRMRERYAESVADIPGERVVQVARYNELIVAWRERAFEDPQACRVYLDILGRRDKLLGTAAPIQIRHSGDAAAPIRHAFDDLDTSALNTAEKRKLHELLLAMEPPAAAVESVEDDDDG